MPLTPCHAAAAWPIRRWVPALPLVPLVVGTMAPDFHYFLPAGVSRDSSHTAPGLLWFCLPAGMAAWAAFEILVRPGLGRLLPAAVAAAVERRASAGAAAAAVLVGAATHVAWDSFTHAQGWAVLRWPLLATDAASGIPWFKVLQHGSTIVGGLLLVAWTRGWIRTPGPRAWPDGAVRRWTIVFAAAAAGAVVNASRAPRIAWGPALGFAALGAMGAFAGALLLVAQTPRTAPRSAPPG